MPSWLPSLASLFFLALLIRLWLWPDRRGPWIGAALLFLACLYGFHWIFVSLHTYGLMPAPVASIATALLALYVSAYGILAGWVIRSALQARASRVPVWSKVLFMAGVITLLEWVRGWLFSGFPWLGWGYHQVDGWLAGFAPWLGVYGVTFFASLTAALIAIGQPKPLFAALFIPLLGGALGSVQFDEPVGSPLRVALIQGAVPQQMKFDPQFIATTKQRHLEMGSALSTPGVRVDLIVFPETAFIQSWQDDPEAAEGLQRLADRAQAVVMTGMPLRDVLAQRYRGSRYSFGYPACPNVADSRQQLAWLDAQRIAGAFLVPPATMSQRLVRAKARINWRRSGTISLRSLTARTRRCWLRWSARPNACAPGWTCRQQNATPTRSPNSGRHSDP